MKSEQLAATRSSCQDALILVDLQHDFLPGGTLAVRDGDQVIPVANRLQPRFDCVVATRDRHPKDHASFAASHPGRRPGETILLDGRPQVLWPTHCVAGSPGAMLSANLQPHPQRHEVFKGEQVRIDSYSGFYDNDQRHQTQLHDFLHSRNVQRVFIMGLATDYCVKFTALDAVRLGYETYLILDGCRGVDLQAGDVERALDELRDAGVFITDSEAVVKRRAIKSRVTRESDCLENDAGGLLAETPHLQLRRRNGWDFVCRSKARGVVAIVAVTPDDRLLLIEQYRPPVRQRVIELPAGLVADTAATEGESLEQAAVRELLEETGYRAGQVRCLLTGASSAGLTDELTHFLLATRLERVADGGGDATEDITVHQVPLTSAGHWLRQQARAGQLIDARVPSGLYLLEREW